MKQYTTPEQTAKLIELGFEKPNMALVKAESLYQSGTDLVWRTTNYEQNYSIDELIEMLPSHIGLGKPLMIKRCEGDLWWVGYKNVPTDKDEDRIYSIWSADYELIDALYDMVVKLKEEGVI